MRAASSFTTSAQKPGTGAGICTKAGEAGAQTRTKTRENGGAKPYSRTGIEFAVLRSAQRRPGGV